MKNIICIAFLILSSCSLHVLGQESGSGSNDLEVFIAWETGKSAGAIEVLNGTLSEIKIIKGKGRINGNDFVFRTSTDNRIALCFTSFKVDPGAGATLVTVKTTTNPFSFFLRDVGKDYPIYIPEYHVVVLPEGDTRSYDQVEATVKGRGVLTKLQQIENLPEESFELVKDRTRNQSVPTWLGISPPSRRNLT